MCPCYSQHCLYTDVLLLTSVLVPLFRPIPKGRNVSITDSGNYRGISLCSVFAKLFPGFLLINSVIVCLHQICSLVFTKKHSTSLCTMALKETLAYYSVDGVTAFCTLLDAAKAFGRVDYCKLFREVIKRACPSDLS